jgi:uncharacterized cupin superfamily protein
MANILSPEWEAELPGLRGQRVGAAAGAEKLGATLYEIDPGGRVSPLHVHHANEELLIVLSGTPTLRTGEGGASGAKRAMFSAIVPVRSSTSCGR